MEMNVCKLDNFGPRTTYFFLDFGNISGFSIREDLSNTVNNTVLHETDTLFLSLNHCKNDLY